jgi:hypothetical protein
MKIFLTILLLVISLTTFSQSSETLLILPCGKYADWTNFNLKYLTFKKVNDLLAIDTTYNLELDNFKPCQFERLEEYPKISQFLDKTLAAYKEMKRAIDEKKCESLAPIYIKFIEGQNIDLIRFESLLECRTKYRRMFAAVNEELERLKTKYAR